MEVQFYSNNDSAANVFNADLYDRVHSSPGTEKNHSGPYAAFRTASRPGVSLNSNSCANEFYSNSERQTTLYSERHGSTQHHMRYRNQMDSTDPFLRRENPESFSYLNYIPSDSNKQRFLSTSIGLEMTTRFGTLEHQVININLPDDFQIHGRFAFDGLPHRAIFRIDQELGLRTSHYRWIDAVVGRHNGQPVLQINRLSPCVTCPDLNNSAQWDHAVAPGRSIEIPLNYQARPQFANTREFFAVRNGTACITADLRAEEWTKHPSWVVPVRQFAGCSF